MKLVAIEMLYPKGHKSLNKSLIKILAEFSNVYITDYNDYYNGLSETENIKKIRIKRQFFPKKGASLIRLCLILNLLLIKLKLKRIDYDAIVLFSINNIAFSFARFLFRNKPIIVFHHNDIDLLSKKRENIIFRKYMNTLDHVVFADFIREGLIDQTGVNPERVHTVNHPITEPRVDSVSNIKNRGTNTFVGLGLSNDETFIDELIALDKADLYKSSNTRIIMRSRNKEYKGNMVDVISGYLDNEDYLRMYHEASACLMCYPATFRLRYSGSFINAMLYQKKVITTDTLLGRHLNSKYPHNCLLAHNVNDLMQIIMNFDDTYSHIENELFLQEHSDENISGALRNIIGRRIYGNK